jgi:hypothetical protein
MYQNVLSFSHALNKNQVDILIVRLNKGKLRMKLNLNHSYQDGQVDFAKSSGIYVYSEPDAANWRLPIEVNENSIWYIGKSDGNLAGRVWNHLGCVYEPGTNEACNPRFKYHQWAEVQGIPDVVRKSVFDGNVVVYIIEVTPNGDSPGFAHALEKYLLVLYFRRYGHLPPLNAAL